MNDTTTVNYCLSDDLELLKFAEEFSDTWNIVSIGEYYSSNKKYHIRYTEDFLTPSGIKISIDTGIIEVSKQYLDKKQYIPDFIFFLILWCVVCSHERDMMIADKKTLEYYLTTQRSKKNILVGYIKLFNDAQSPLNINRYKEIEKILSKS